LPEAKYAAQPYADRLWELVYDRSLYSLVSDTGEQTMALVPGQIDIYLRDRGTVKGSVANLVVRFLVRTEK
jgi:hypothetical protein